MHLELHHHLHELRAAVEHFFSCPSARCRRWLGWIGCIRLLIVEYTQDLNARELESMVRCEFRDLHVAEHGSRFLVL